MTQNKFYLVTNTFSSWRATLMILISQLMILSMLPCGDANTLGPPTSIGQIFLGITQLIFYNIVFVGFWIFIAFARAKASLYIPKADPGARIRLERNLIIAGWALFAVSVGLLMGLGIKLYA